MAVMLVQCQSLPLGADYHGQPWYLTTAAVAEQLYDALIVWDKEGSLKVTEVSLPFFRQFSTVSIGTYLATSLTYRTLTDAIKSFADGFLAMNAKYTPPDGSLAEQYHRDNGTPLSALDLTWSYAATLTAFSAREGKHAAEWGAKGLSVPSVCESNTGPVVDITFNVEATTVWGGSSYNFPRVMQVISHYC